MGTLERVKYGSIKIPQEPHIEKREMADGSFQAYVYDRARTEVTVKFTEEKFYDYSSGCYRLSYRAVPNVIERKIVYVISVVRKSVHNFKVNIQSKEGTLIESAKTYDEINEIILPLFAKKKK